MPCYVILLDFSRAFDKVMHIILLTKLKRSDITGNEDWQADFLSNRTRYVSYKAAQSHPMYVTYGVVQGTVAG